LGDRQRRGPGINGGLLRRRGETPPIGGPVNAFVCTIGVDDIDAALEAVRRAGSKGMAMDKTEFPNYGWVAYFFDPAGNIVGLHQAVRR
jgi:predicted enzyme related to lactoylglutathione lyase